VTQQRDPVDKQATPSLQGDLFADGGVWRNAAGETDWPDQERFPLNRPSHSVEEVVAADLKEATEPLIVTGFAALDRIILFLADLGEAKARLLLGSEPFESRLRSFVHRGHSFPAEVRDYWLHRGISLFQSARLIAAIQRMESGQVRVRYLDAPGRMLHAKLYCGDDAVTLGSSNFTRAGMATQFEANVRFRRDKDSRRYREVRQIAENYWSLGTDYTAELLDLLHQLLRVVGWQEALARACAELLEGQWARAYLEHQLDLGDTRLWPSQQAGIAQAMWVLENVGSVLVADPTGSGKTRMGAHLLRALVDRTWSSGRGRRDLSVLVSPPPVVPTWIQEATNCGLSLQTHSHGLLSHAGHQAHAQTAQAVQRAQILAVDEAHNFLNVSSQRSQGLLGNMADHVVLFTATPINRGATDLLSLVDMLGADNLEDETLRRLELLGKRKGSVERALAPSDVQALREEINRFTVRRTKAALNQLVDRSPQDYVDAQGRRCRYPSHRSVTYRTGESEHDNQLAERIRDTAATMRGIAWLESRIELPDALRREGWSDQSFLQGRLSAVRSLSGYSIMSRLRSSNAALHEHLEGTQSAVRLYNLAGFDKPGETGNVLAKLQARAEGGPPTCLLNCELPDWLRDPAAWRHACEQEIAACHRILQALSAMSMLREKTKARLLQELQSRHRLVLAFDSHLITLEVIKAELDALGCAERAVIATGSSHSGRTRVMRQFSRESAAEGLALCSDAMSEGINLQGASAVVHLDMPSVVRIAEQRVGRVDRMDSPHAEIEAWWPDDGESFALRTDERFVQRYWTVDALLGSNLPLPDHLAVTREPRRVSATEMIQEAEQQAPQAWDGIRDAFDPVRGLLEGANPLVPQALYREYLEVSTRVLSRVSLVRSRQAWAFFALAGSRHRAPKWVLLEGPQSEPIVRLDRVCALLQDRLGGDVQSLPMTEQASAQLDNFLNRLVQAELHLLPRKKQRALSQMHAVLAAQRDLAQRRGEPETAMRLNALAQLAIPAREGSRADLDAVAEAWLDWLKPWWFDKLRSRGKRRRPLLLRDLNKDLLKQRIDLDRLEARFQDIPVVDSLDERVAACIVGVNG
jgi:superfamily II DNA or RNA helicase